MSRPVLAGILFLAAVLGVIIYSSLSMGRRVRAEVCVDYQGRTACKTVSGDTQQHVVQTAVSGACAEIAGGVTDTIACEHTTPKSIAWK